MATVRKKTWPEFFELVKAGKKRFELRVADFEIQEGDTLVLEEWDPEVGDYTGRKIEKRAGYVLKVGLDQFGQKDALEKHGLYLIRLED